jgi:cytochrome d ubiquinol oxidase subunit I
VAHTQPEKFAAIEGLYISQPSAPMVFFAIPYTKPPELKAVIELKGLLSWMAFGDVNVHIKGINEFPPENIPPLWLTFVSFHNMVVLGLYFIALTFYATYLLRKNKLFEKKWLLKLFMWSIPLPLAACQLGWITAEVGRQPWIVYGLLRTSDASSITVTAPEILFSIILFGCVYLLLGVLYVYLLVREVKHGPQPAKA